MQKIKITIGDRLYPLSVTEGQEEFLRNSAKQIDQMMKHYEQNYAVQDKQDVLAMCALQLALQHRQVQQSDSQFRVCNFHDFGQAVFWNRRPLKFSFNCYGCQLWRSHIMDSYDV